MAGNGRGKRRKKRRQCGGIEGCLGNSGKRALAGKHKKLICPSNQQSGCGSGIIVCSYNIDKCRQNNQFTCSAGNHVNIQNMQFPDYILTLKGDFYFVVECHSDEPQDFNGKFHGFLRHCISKRLKSVIFHALPENVSQSIDIDKKNIGRWNMFKRVSDEEEQNIKGFIYALLSSNNPIVQIHGASIFINRFVVVWNKYMKPGAKSIVLKLKN